jgi:hypothetical protein
MSGEVSRSPSFFFHPFNVFLSNATDEEILNEARAK